MYHMPNQVFFFRSELVSYCLFLMQLSVNVVKMDLDVPGKLIFKVYIRDTVDPQFCHTFSLCISHHTVVLVR